MPTLPRTLGEMRAFRRQLEIDCARCPRRGRVSVERLVAEHGEGMTWKELQALLPGGCPKRHARDVDRCAPGFPQLPEIARELFGPDWWRLPHPR